MKKNDMLPVIAAFVIALLCFPILAIPVQAAVPTTSGLASVVTIPEDDLKRNTGVMVLGMDPLDYMLVLKATDNWFTGSTCAEATRVSATNLPAGATWDATYLGAVVGPELSLEPVLTPTYITLYQTLVAPGAACVRHRFLGVWWKASAPGWDLVSQHKILATLNGVPTTPTSALCEIVEKEKAKIPPQSDKPVGKRQFPDEQIKTTLQDVTTNFICKFHWIKPGVGALDVYFVGPQISNFIADHMLIVTVYYTVGRTTIWASELQDICILGWSMGLETLAIGLYLPYMLSTGWYVDTYFSWDDAIGHFVSCDEAAAWQLAWMAGGWPYSEN